jgi:hypothetical protein
VELEPSTDAPAYVASNYVCRRTALVSSPSGCARFDLTPDGSGVARRAVLFMLACPLAMIDSLVSAPILVGANVNVNCAVEWWFSARRK